MSLESYPPQFRHLVQPQLLEFNSTTGSKSTSNSDPIPVIDLQHVIEGKEKEKFEEACKEWGVFRLINHGIPKTFLEKLQDSMDKVFSLPFETKQGLLTTPFSYFWGTGRLTKTGEAISRGADVNLVEGVYTLATQISQFQPQDHHILTSFRDLLEEYGKYMHKLATKLFEAMAKNLNLEVESKSAISEPSGFFRLYRYPSYSNPEAASGLEPHTDSSTVAILSENFSSGLQVFKDDQWFTIEHIPNTLIVNLGDMIKALSNDQYHSVLHKVKVNKYKERYSICYFVFPEEGNVIKSSKYKPFTYNDFQAQVQEDIKTVGRKVGLERFKLEDSTNGF
ncbi:hypothetical protein UlMin_013166 [Ulmus minor]